MRHWRLIDRVATILKRGPRYLAVSVCCFIVNNVILIGLDRQGINDGFSVLVCMAVVIPLGFVLQSRFTFATPLHWSAFMRYAPVLLLNGPISYLLLSFFHGLLRIDMLFAAPLCTGLLMVWNYVISSWAIRARQCRPRKLPEGDHG